MSDQFTRIRCGGSPLDASAPVEGILFGQGMNSTNSNNSNTSITSIPDAGDIPLDDAQTQIDLHRAVFPQQYPVGWYKVVVHDATTDDHPNADTAEPTLADLQQTIRVAQAYVNKSNVNEESVVTPTLLGILQVPSMTNQTKQPSSHKNDDDDEDEEELPLTLYQLSRDHKSLQALPNGWQLTTATSERVAVQRVMREKATAMNDNEEDTPAHQTAVSSDNTAATTTNTPSFIWRDSHAWQVTRQSETLVPHMDDLRESIHAIDHRLTKLLVVLQQQQQQQQHSPSSWALVRQIHGLLLQLGPIAATCPPKVGNSTTLNNDNNNDNNNSHQLFSQVAQLAQAVDSVTLYAEKCKFVSEHSSSSSGPRPMVRRF